MHESGAITSLHLSTCGRWITTTLLNSIVHLWRLPSALGQGQGLGGELLPVQLTDGSGSGSAADSLRQHRWQGSVAAGAVETISDTPLHWALPAAPLHEFCMAVAR